mmetsp:Transcript_64576/g.131240  ORF Transcript_64576/g.131240 Transcript_64576/m.131240 type:complete len:223 (-) Transcript_64576:425-1093(-)
MSSPIATPPAVLMLATSAGPPGLAPSVTTSAPWTNAAPPIVALPATVASPWATRVESTPDKVRSPVTVVSLADSPPAALSLPDMVAVPPMDASPDAEMSSTVMAPETSISPPKLESNETDSPPAARRVPPTEASCSTPRPPSVITRAPVSLLVDGAVADTSTCPFFTSKTPKLSFAGVTDPSSRSLACTAPSMILTLETALSAIASVFTDESAIFAEVTAPS